MRSSLFQQFNLQRLFPGCSYGTYTFFVDEESTQKRSKFTLQAVSAGDYYFIRYNLLKLLSQYDKTMSAIHQRYSFLKELYGTPECDFKIYRKRRNLREIFV